METVFKKVRRKYSVEVCKTKSQLSNENMYIVTVNIRGQECETHTFYTRDGVNDLLAALWNEYVGKENTPDKVRKRMKQYHIEYQLNMLKKSYA